MRARRGAPFTATRESALHLPLAHHQDETALACATLHISILGRSRDRRRIRALEERRGRPSLVWSERNPQSLTDPVIDRAEAMEAV